MKSICIVAFILSICSMQIAANDEKFSLCAPEKGYKVSPEEKKYLLRIIRKGFRCTSTVVSAIADIPLPALTAVDVATKTVCFVHRLCLNYLHRNATGRSRYMLSENEGVQLMNCYLRLVNMVDAKSLTMLIRITETEAAGVNLNAAVSDLFHCALRYVRFLPGNPNTAFKFAEMTYDTVRAMVS